MGAPIIILLFFTWAQSKFRNTSRKREEEKKKSPLLINLRLENVTYMQHHRASYCWTSVRLLSPVLPGPWAPSPASLSALRGPNVWCSIARALRAAHSQRKGREEGPGHFFSLLATSNRSLFLPREGMMKGWRETNVSYQ